MERTLEVLELVDLGDAKEVTKGPYTTQLQEEGPSMIHKTSP